MITRNIGDQTSEVAKNILLDNYVYPDFAVNVIELPNYSNADLSFSAFSYLLDRLIVKGEYGTWSDLKIVDAPGTATHASALRVTRLSEWRDLGPIDTGDILPGHENAVFCFYRNR